MTFVTCDPTSVTVTAGRQSKKMSRWGALSIEEARNGERVEVVWGAEDRCRRNGVEKIHCARALVVGHLLGTALLGHLST